MSRIYLDYAATTFIRDEVFAAMEPYLRGRFANPSSPYLSGREARKAVEDARADVAEAIGVRPGEVYFTSGGTESDNWAIRLAAARNGDKGGIVTSAVEHDAVLRTCEGLEREGRNVTYLPVDEYGAVCVEQAARCIGENTAVVSIMTANNEVGTINPVSGVAKLAREAGTLFHTDAVAAAGKISLNAADFDLLSISAHKFYGPKGIGALYVREGITPVPLINGGGQERGRRAGTENVAGIVGMAAALKLAVAGMRVENERLKVLETYMKDGLVHIFGGEIKFNGHPEHALPGYVNVCLPKKAGSMLVALDRAGVECSAGSACSSSSALAARPSHVLAAMGLGGRAAYGMRFTMGAGTTKAEVDCVLGHIGDICAGRR